MEIMIESKLTIRLNASPDRVWAVVTDNQNTSWRSDLSRVEVTEGGAQFTEYTRDGFPTTFRITKKEPLVRYEFDLNNKNMSGHWTGEFREVPGGTELVFTEQVEIAGLVMRLLAKPYLKRQQKQYARDLKNALGE